MPTPLAEPKHVLSPSTSLHENLEIDDTRKEEITTRMQEADVPLEQRRMESRVMRKVDWRLIPILGLLYSVAGLDRVNVCSSVFLLLFS